MSGMYRFKLPGNREALVQTFYLVGAPCLLTSLTTAAGFGAMSFVPIRSVSEMGVYGAFGVVAAFVLSRVRERRELSSGVI